MNQQKNSSSKNFYIIIKKSNFSKQESNQENIFQELNEMYFKIKECLSKVGNLSIPLEEKKEILKLFSDIWKKELKRSE